MSGRGRIRSWCVFERPYFPECPAPWPVVAVELEEGPLFISNPHGISPDELAEGAQVAVTFIDCADETGQYRLPVFQLDSEG
jgi:uncharacterized OB-fold protein